MTALICTGGAFVYLMLVGVFYTLWDEDQDFDVPLSLIWPLVLPWYTGYRLIRWLRRPKLPKAQVVR